MDVRALLGTFEGAGISGCAGNSRILASWTSKRNSYHLVTKGRMHVIGGDPSSDVIPELDPQPDDYYIPKFRWSAFYQTSLDLSLRTRGIDTVIISGGSTDVGVASTVFSGKDMDYNIIVVSDACATSTTNAPTTR